MTSTLLVLLLLSQSERPDNPPAGEMELPLPAPSARRLHYLTRLEVAGLALLPSDEVEGAESYVQLIPMLVVAEGEVFGLNLGALVRLRLSGGELGAGVVRPGAFASLGLGVDNAR